jgi:hypothetical protein
LVRDSDDFNTVDAFRLLDKNAECEVSRRDLADTLLNDVRVDQNKCDVRAVEILVDDMFKYSQFCEIFVPKSQKVLSELTAKKPKNLKGQLSYNECFDNVTRELYAQAWEHILQSASRENKLKAELMRDSNFEISDAFRQIARGKEITRDDLLDALNNDLD